MAQVTFKQDVFPYCKGDVVELSSAEKKRVDEVVKARGLEGDVYVSGAHQVFETVDDPRELSAKRAEQAREDAQAQHDENVAVVEAQANAVAEPADPIAVAKPKK